MLCFWRRTFPVPTCEFKSRVAALAARRSGFCDYLSMPPRKMDQTGYSRERNPFCHTILITFCRCQVLYFSRSSDSNQNVSFFAQFAFFWRYSIHFMVFCGIISLGAFPENIWSTLCFSYDHTSGQILSKSAAVLPYKITKFRLFSTRSLILHIGM